MAGGRPQGSAGIDPDRRVRAHSVVVGLSGLGLGHRGRGARARLSQALRVGDGAQRSHPPNHAEGRGQRHVPHRHVDRLSAASAGHSAFTGPAESRGRQVALASRRYRHHFQTRAATARDHRQAAAGLRRKNSIMRTTMTRKICVAAVFAAATLAAMAMFAAQSAQAANTEVQIDQFTFAPQRVTVKAGTTVIWINDDDVPHTVASSSKFFKSKALDTKDKFSFTFTTPGTYEYFCSLHPHMTGAIVVEAATGSTAAQ